MIAHEAQPAFGLEALAVEGHDAGRLLAAVLQGVQAQRCQGCGIGVAIDAEYAALLAQPVAVEVEVRYPCSLAVALPECRLLRELPVPSMRLSRPWVSLFW